MKTTVEQFVEKPSRARMLTREQLSLEVTELLTQTMERGGVSRSELAARLGKSKAYVTQVLRGRHNMTLRTFADLAWALKVQVQLSTSPEISFAKVSSEEKDLNWFVGAFLRYDAPSVPAADREAEYHTPRITNIEEMAA